MEQMKQKRNNNKIGENNSNSIHPKVEPETSIWNTFQSTRGELSEPLKRDERSFDCSSAPHQFRS